MQNEAEVTYFMIRSFLKRGDKMGDTYPFEHVSILTKLSKIMDLFLSFVSMETFSKG